MLFRSLMVTLITVFAVGCATQTPYKPADGPEKPGYATTKLGEKRYRVTFTGNSSTPAETVQNYALYRAAQLTMENGYDWFQIANRGTDKKVRESTSFSGGVGTTHTHVYQRCGLLSCDTAVATTSPSVGVGTATTNTSRSYTTSLEIVMGDGEMPDSAESYDARDLASTLRNLVDKGS